MKIIDAAKVAPPVLLVALLRFVYFPPAAVAGNDILGEVRLVPYSGTEKLAGVWIDRIYVGYVGELKG